jgi:seryl-tRNA synthetase
MADFRPATPDQAQFMNALFERGLFIDSGVPGVYGRGARFEEVLRSFDDLVTRFAADDAAEVMRFPPVLPRRNLESSGYLKSFPHLAASVFGFEGTEAQAAEQHERATRHEDWAEFQSMTDLVMTPAACYPVYPAVAARGPLAPGGIVVDAGASYVFRREPSGDPARLQMFHQREMVRLGEPETVVEWRNRWLDRSLEMLRGLGLEAESDVATDPFFGRGGRMLAASQREQALKFEILVPIAGPEPTAVVSFNYHQDHFASAHGLTFANEGEVHTACLGFGLERITLALLHAHGLDVDAWPESVRGQLWGP